MSDPGETAATSVIERFFAALNDRDHARLVKTLHPEVTYRFHINGFDTVFGHDGMVAALDGIYSIFPDFHEDLLSLRGNGDLMVAGWRITGSLAGPFPTPDGYALPVHRQPTVTVEGVDVFQLRDGLIAVKETYADPTPWYRAYAHLVAA
jgi:ketosteroid isomerase-like protein